MGKDIHVKVAKYNTSTNLYEELQLFRKRKPDEKEYKFVDGIAVDLPWTEFKEIHIDLGRDYEMMNGMRDGDEKDGYGYFPWTSINFASLESSFAEKIKKEMNTDGTYDFHEISLADAHNYLYSHPVVTDYEADEWNGWNPGDPVPKKENPIKEAIEEIEKFISIADSDSYNYNPYSYYKVIFYFDW